MKKWGVLKNDLGKNSRLLSREQINCRKGRGEKMSRKEIGNQKTVKNSLGILTIAGIAILLLAAMAPVVSAGAVRVYAYKAADVQGADGSHRGLFFTIPHGTLPYSLKYVDNCGSCYRPYVGGVNLALLLSIPYEEHKDPQKWEYFSRTQVNQYTDETVLMIPTLYTWANWNYKNEIYIDVVYK